MLEKLIERVLFATRWLLAPLCIAMSLVLVVLGYVFMKELWHMLSHLDTISETDLVLSALGLVDLLFMAGLVLMVLLASYESFVSKLDKVDASEITWLKHTDFNALKLVAISAIFLLKRYMSLEDVLSSIPKDTPLSHNPIFWQVVIHLVFVCSALLAAVTNNIAFSQNNKGH
ncbi:TIGR00645 family protein [Helicobacter pylori]